MCSIRCLYRYVVCRDKVVANLNVTCSQMFLFNNAWCIPRGKWGNLGPNPLLVVGNPGEGLTQKDLLEKISSMAHLVQHHVFSFKVASQMPTLLKAHSSLTTSVQQLIFRGILLVNLELDYPSRFL